MHRDAGAPTKSRATERARRAWGDMARQVRCDLRSIGLRGPTPHLDRQVVGDRGVKAPDQLTSICENMRDGGLSEAHAETVLVTLARQVVALTYAETDIASVTPGGAA